MKAIIFIFALGFSMKAFSFNKEADTTKIPLNERLECLEMKNDCYQNVLTKEQTGCQTSEVEKKSGPASKCIFYKSYVFPPCVSKRVLL